MLVCVCVGGVFSVGKRIYVLPHILCGMLSGEIGKDKVLIDRSRQTAEDAQRVVPVQDSRSQNVTISRNLTMG